MPHHYTRDDRVALAALLREGLNQAEAARNLGIHRSTVCRELLRNAREDGSYHATHADCLARERRRRSKEGTRLLENNEKLAGTVEAMLDPLISPKDEVRAPHRRATVSWLGGRYDQGLDESPDTDACARKPVSGGRSHARWHG